MRTIYLDWNATTPPRAEVIAAMVEAATHAWGNPASLHGTGRRARARVEDAREAIASLAGLDPRDLLFTSGGTEANNLALFHAFAEGLSASQTSGRPRDALVLSRIEHPSVVKMAEHLAERGVLVVWASPEASGRVSIDALVDAMDRAKAEGAEVRLVALQAVNHETGVVQPVAEMVSLCRDRKVVSFVDAIQAIGKVAPEVWRGADLVSVTAHKIRGPKGIGALVTRPSIRLRRLFHGGSQERGLRPGTLDPVACAGFLVAVEHARSMPARYATIASLRGALFDRLVGIGREVGCDVVQNGEGDRVPHVLNVSFPGWRGEELCAALDLERVAVSSGSACSAGTAEPSPVLAAMVGPTRALSAVRISLGEETTLEDVHEAAERFARVLKRLAPEQTKR